MGNAIASFFRNLTGYNTTHIANAYNTTIWVCQSNKSLNIEGLRINTDILSGVFGGEVNINQGVQSTAAQVHSGGVHELQRTRGREYVAIFDVAGNLLAQQGISANKSYIVTETGSFTRQKVDSKNLFEDIHGVTHNMSQYHFNITHIANASDYDIWVGMSQGIETTKLSGIVKVPTGEFHRYPRLNPHELMTIKNEAGVELVSTYPIEKNKSYIFTKNGGLVEQKYGCRDLFEDLFGRTHGFDDGTTHIANAYSTDIYTSLSSTSDETSENELKQIYPGSFVKYKRQMGVNLLKLFDKKENIIISTKISPNASYIVTKELKLAQQKYGHANLFTDINNFTHSIDS